jgi:DNA-binding transcriptional regulator GbsR (MarR family)
MEEAVRRFIGKMGFLCQDEGMARNAGHIFGLLLATGETLPLDEIAERLEVSKASVSTNARLLEQIGFVQRAAVTGDRRDFYRVEDDPWEKMLRVSQSRWRTMVEVFADAAENLPGEDGRRRAVEAETFHRLLIEGSEELIENWQGLRARAADLKRNLDSAS